MDRDRWPRYRMPQPVPEAADPPRDAWRVRRSPAGRGHSHQPLYEMAYPFRSKDEVGADGYQSVRYPVKHRASRDRGLRDRASRDRGLRDRGLRDRASKHPLRFRTTPFDSLGRTIYRQLLTWSGEAKADASLR